MGHITHTQKIGHSRWWLCLQKKALVRLPVRGKPSFHFAIQTGEGKNNLRLFHKGHALRLVVIIAVLSRVISGAINEALLNRASMGADPINARISYLIIAGARINQTAVFFN